MTTTTESRIEVIKDSKVDKKTISELMWEIKRIKGVTLTSQEAMINVIFLFLTELNGDLNNLYNGGIDKILSA